MRKYFNLKMGSKLSILLMMNFGAHAFVPSYPEALVSGDYQTTLAEQVFSDVSVEFRTKDGLIFDAFAADLSDAKIGVTGPSTAAIPLGQDTVYTFRVTNYGEAGNFRFDAADDKNFIVDMSAYNADIASGGYVDVQVILNSGLSTEGTISTLIFRALSTADDALPSGTIATAKITATDKKSTGSGNGIAQGTLITTGAAVNEDGSVQVWGFRGSSQQGNGAMVVQSNAKPAPVKSLSAITSLHTGAYHLIALDASGSVYGWGQSGYGETGCAPTYAHYVSTPCTVLSNAVQIAAGEYFSIALDKEGRAWTWGHNLYGQLGNGGDKNSKTPVQVNLNGEKVRLIGGAYEGAFAVTEEGHVWAWGDNEASGLGFQGPIYGVQKIIRTPTRVPNLDAYAKNIVTIAGGNGWGEALLDNGVVIGWGLHAALGQGTAKTNISSPYPVEIMRDVKQLFARYVGSVALTNDGKIYTWGQTGGSAFKMIYGEFVTQRTTYDNVTEIGGGKEHVFYKTKDGSLYGVGYNDLFKLNLDKCCAPTINWPGVKITYQ